MQYNKHRAHQNRKHVNKDINICSLIVINEIAVSIALIIMYAN